MSHAKLVSEPDEIIVKLISFPVLKISYAPTDDSFLHIENYKDFLKERRVRIAERLNEFLG